MVSNSTPSSGIGTRAISTILAIHLSTTYMVSRSAVSLRCLRARFCRSIYALPAAVCRLGLALIGNE